MLTRNSPLLLLALLFPILVSGQDVRTLPKEYPVVSPALQKVAAGQPDQQPIKIWVYFTDKNLVYSSDERSALKKANRLLSKESLSRRHERGLTAQIVGFKDYPVAQKYVQEVLEIPGVQKMRVESRWLNAVSLEAEPVALQEISRLPFVRKIDVDRKSVV